MCRYLRRSGLDISAVQVRHLHGPSGELLISSVPVVGREPIPSRPTAPSPEGILERVSPELRPLFDAVRQAATGRLGLREEVLRTGFAFRDARNLIVAGIYRATNAKAGLYTYRKAARALGGDIEEFYRAVKERGFDTPGRPETSIHLGAEDIPRLDALWDLFETYLTRRQGAA